MIRETLAQKLETAIASANEEAVMETLDDVFESSEVITIDQRHADLARQTGNRKVIRLVDAWVRKDNKASVGLSALYFAAKHNNQEVVQALVNTGVHVTPDKREPGQKMPDGTIYLGRYSPKDRDGNSLSKTFNVFAAPEDLTDTSGKKDTFKYVDAVKRVKDLKGFHGHDGESYATDKELNQALKNGTYKGGWIIPTRELLIGTEADGPSGIRKGGVVRPDNLYDHREKGALKGTFCTEAVRDGSSSKQSYWSCTEYREYPGEYPPCVWVANFSDDGFEGWGPSDISRMSWVPKPLSCRPVRLVEVKTP